GVKVLSSTTPRACRELCLSGLRQSSTVASRRIGRHSCSSPTNTVTSAKRKNPDRGSGFFLITGKTPYFGWSLLAASSFFCSFFSFLAFFLAAFFSAFSSFLVSVFLSAVPVSCCANDTDDSENVRATANNNVSSFFIVQTLLEVFVRILLPGGGSTTGIF